MRDTGWCGPLAAEAAKLIEAQSKGPPVSYEYSAWSWAEPSPAPAVAERSSAPVAYEYTSWSWAEEQAPSKAQPDGGGHLTRVRRFSKPSDALEDTVKGLNGHAAGEHGKPSITVSDIDDSQTRGTDDVPLPQPSAIQASISGFMAAVGQSGRTSVDEGSGLEQPAARRPNKRPSMRPSLTAGYGIIQSIRNSMTRVTDEDHDKAGGSSDEVERSGATLDELLAARHDASGDAPDDDPLSAAVAPVSMPSVVASLRPSLTDWSSSLSQRPSQRISGLGASLGGGLEHGLEATVGRIVRRRSLKSQLAQSRESADRIVHVTFAARLEHVGSI